MRILKGVALVLAGLLVLLTLVGFFLPSTWHAEESVEIAADAANILPLVDTPKRWLEWAPWTPERYPEMKNTFPEPASGPGARWEWTGEGSGTGSLEITRSDPETGIEFLLRFEEFPPSTGGIDFESSEVGTRVSWWIQGDVGKNPFARYFTLLMEPMMRKDLVAGLEKLGPLAVAAQEAAEKEAAEREAAERAAAEAALAEAEALEGEAADGEAPAADGLAAD